MTHARRNLLGMTKEELSRFAESIGERRYRGSQLFQWLYARGATSFDAMTDLGKAFRERLAEAATIGALQPVRHSVSDADGTTKYLFALADGLRIESVLIPPASAFRAGGEEDDDDEQRRLTLCVSTQVGCALDCAFCATGTMGFRRNLTAGEIVDQFLQVRRLSRRRITNVVFMGMGEPLLNYAQTMTASGLFAEGMGVPARRITISSAGIASKIRQMADEGRKPKLALSLHSAVEETRAGLMPITKKHGLAELRSALEYNYRKLKRRVTYEVILFDGVNDTEREVRALIAFARHIPCKVNIIPFHSIAFTGIAGSARKLRPSRKQDAIVERLRTEHLTVMVRSSAGEDITGACGQLAIAEGDERGERPSGRR
jgi:23S rRNA (adenine2503-C2)-methyltransferase